LARNVGNTVCDKSSGTIFHYIGTNSIVCGKVKRTALKKNHFITGINEYIAVHDTWTIVLPLLSLSLSDPE
jgi:hypothetical protein